MTLAIAAQRINASDTNGNPNMLELGGVNGIGTFNGTAVNMLMTVEWKG